MPKNKGKGGKKNKRGKNKKGFGEIKRALQLPNDGERIARVIKALGSCRFRVFIYENSEDVNKSNINKPQSRECIAKLRGSRSLRRKGWIKPESYVIISKREYATKQNIVDIVHLYKDAETMELISQGYIPSNHSDNEFGVIDFSNDVNISNTYYDDSDISDNENDL